MWLGPFLALVPVSLPQAGIRGDPVAQDLELASLAITAGIRGGIASRMPRVQLAASYDRVDRVFRVLRRKGDPIAGEMWTAEIEPEQFRALLELALATGLPELPLENPPSCMDLYGRSRQIRLDYGEVQWANGAPGGCVESNSTVIPTEAERQRFDEVIARLERAVDDLPLYQRSELELPTVPFVPDVRALKTYRPLMEHVLADPARHDLDLERVAVWENNISFSWRGRQPDPSVIGVRFESDRLGKVARADVSKKRVDDIVPIATGMTLDDVLKHLGRPDGLEERLDGSVVLSYLGSFPRNRMFPIPPPARLRFENGRLCAP